MMTGVFCIALRVLHRFLLLSRLGPLVLYLVFMETPQYELG